MKRVLLAILLFTRVFGAYAQEEELPDSLAFSDSPHRPFLLSIIHAPVLEGLTEPRLILPNDRVLCYDKIISFKTNTASGCLFIDTEGGFMAYIPPKEDISPACLIKPEDVRFNLNVMGLRGNVYNYFNFRKANVLQHGYTTGLTETYQYTFNSTPETVTLRNTNESKEFLGGKIKAYRYKPDGRDEEWYLFGKEFPEKVNFAPKKYLGNFGIGYQQAEEGLFLIMQVSGSLFDSEITDIKDEQACFDSRPFTSLEEGFFTEVETNIESNREKLEKKSEAIRGDDYCGGLKQRNIQYQQELLNTQERNVQTAQQGSIHQGPVAQQAMRDMYNYEGMMQQSIYETELLICKQEEILSYPANANSPATVQRIRGKISCLEQQMAYQEQVKRELEKLNTQSPDDPLLIQKKGKLVRETMTYPSCK